MKVADFDYTLPPARIAQFPAATREDARLLVLSRDSGTTSHGSIRDLTRHLARGDLLVVNDTRVFPARLLGRRVPSGGTVECLLLARLDEERWEALMHPGQKLRPGGRVVFERDGRVLEGEVLERRFFGRRVIRLWAAGGRDVDDAIEAIGHVPLPPYIHRPDEALDRERYQTVYATRRGSVAAPTAGLHLTDALFRQLETNGVERVAVTLHVGYGTFKPVRADFVEEHHVDAERFVVSEEAASAINTARGQGRRIVAVGTTTTRTLESAVDPDGRIRPGSGETDLFIRPGHQFRVVSGLLTNFHLPRSSLLMLVCAFAGREPTLAAYREAVERGYRFYSYGDAMLIL
jgi:S-adenosylmethionine:tRNA ribosyltransferase-isomerase